MEPSNKRFRPYGKGKGDWISLVSTGRDEIKNKPSFKLTNHRKNKTRHHTPTSCVECFIDFSEFLSKYVDKYDRNSAEFLKVSNEILSYASSLPIICEEKQDELIQEFITETRCL